VEGTLEPYQPTGRPPGRPRTKAHITEAVELLLKAEQLAAKAELLRMTARELLARESRQEIVT
jgi:hypothetical protein